jgi:predicted RNA binding protein YcfA (HicA-like mRNA interferase family)
VKIISGKQMCRVLEQHGWTLARINGSHHIYRHAATGRRAVVPVHAHQEVAQPRKLSVPWRPFRWFEINAS